MNVEVLEVVQSDLAAGADFYERPERGLGAEFRAGILSDFKELAWTGGIHRTEHGHFRCNTSRFPFIIDYTMKSDTASIVAVLDGRMNPETIKNRLSQ